MRAGIDSYSYHRRYGEIRVGGGRPGDRAALAARAGPVLAHARSLAVDDLYLETCYLPEPETITAETLAPAGPVRVGFSWGHPWPAGAFHGLDGGRTPAAEDHLARWIAAAARLGHPVMRITLGSPASRGTEPAPVLVDRLIAPTRRAAERGEVGVKLAIENHGDLRAQDLLEVIERVGLPEPGRDPGQRQPHARRRRHARGARLLAPKTLLVQLKDHPPTPRPGRSGRPAVGRPGGGGRAPRRGHRDPRPGPASTAPCAWSSPRSAARTSTSSP